MMGTSAAPKHESLAEYAAYPNCRSVRSNPLLTD